MEELFFGSAYKGTKKFTQAEVKTSNATGFGAPADDYAERGIDLNEQLVRNKPATYFFRMTGDAMVDAGIMNGDILVVDRSIKAKSGKIVVANLNGEMLVRRFEQTFNKIRLIPDTRRLAAIEVDPFSEFSIWGVVTFAIHELK